MEERLERLRGTQLTPPEAKPSVAGGPPAAPPPALAAVDVRVEGSSWRASTVDIAVAGLGWVAVGCQGSAAFKVWAYPGVSITTHGSLIPDFAVQFEKPGISSLLPKAQQREQGKKGGASQARAGGAGGSGALPRQPAAAAGPGAGAGGQRAPARLAGGDGRL